MIVVAKDQDRRMGTVEKLRKLGVPSKAGDIPVDYMWVARGVPWSGDSKTCSDLIDSVGDGRLHNQTEAMKSTGGVGFILLEEYKTDGYLVADWPFDAFWNQLQRLQDEGIRVDFSASQALTPRRLASLWAWSNRGGEGAFHTPPVLMPTKVRNAEYRAKVGMLMHLPGCGQKKAEALVKEFGIMGALGIDKAPVERWKSIKGIGPKLAEGWRAWLSQ